MPDIPAAAATPLQGTTSVDDKMFFDPERLSYESAGRIAEKIAARINEIDKEDPELGEQAEIVIASSRLLADFANLRAVYLTLADLQREYESIASQAAARTQRQFRTVAPEAGHIVDERFVEGVAAVAGAAGGMVAPAATLVGTALGLVSLFRQDVEYHGEKTLIDALAFEMPLRLG